MSNPCDPNPRFIAPFSADIHNINHWVAGGEFVWDNQGKGWSTNCSATACDWKPVHDTGAGSPINAIADSGPVTYAGWCGSGCNPAGSDAVHLGHRHQLRRDLAHRALGRCCRTGFPTSFTIDPANPAHVVVTFGALLPALDPRRRRRPRVRLPATAARRGPTSAATCRTRRPTARSSGTTSWSSAPTWACSPPATSAPGTWDRLGTRPAGRSRGRPRPCRPTSATCWWLRTAAVCGSSRADRDVSQLVPGRAGN